MPLVLGVDSSTQSTKVEVRDADTGEIVSQARAPHPETTPPRSEQEPAAWWSALQACLSALPRQSIAAVAVAGQQMGLVALDASGEVLRPAKLWNDTESAPEAAELVRRLGARAWADACGSVPVASFTVTKLAWLRAHEPDVYARLAHALLPHDWLTWRLALRFVTDRGDASSTGYYSAREARYRTDLLACVDAERDLAATLPAVLGPIKPAGEVEARVAERLGFSPLAGAVVAPGTGDNMAAALGIGLLPGDVAISIGTSGTVYAVSDRATCDETGAVGGFADATGRFLPLACTLNATKVTNAFARVLGLSREAFDDAALSASPGARGLVLVPYLDGERTPNRPTATGTLGGLRSDVTAAEIARAAVEGVVLGLLEAMDALLAAGVEAKGRVFLIGGGARSPAYRRIACDFLSRPVTIARGDEHVATGACVQAAATLHRVEPAKVVAAWRLGGRR